MTVKPPAATSIAQLAATGAGWVIAWRIVTRNIGLLSTLILVRLLQPEDFGVVAVATGFINSVDALSAIGAQDALVRAPTVDRDLYDTGFTLGVIRGVITALLIAMIAEPVGGFFKDERLAVVMLTLSAGSLISGFESIGIIDFRRNFAFRKEFNLQVWSRACGVAITVALAALWHSYWALVAGILTYRLVRLQLSYLMSPYRPYLTLRAWRPIIGFSLWTWAQTMLYQVRDRIDIVIIARLLGTAQVGVFSVGLELGSLPTTELVEPLCRALYPGFASLHHKSERVGAMFLGAVGLAVLVILPAGIGISMIADPMVRLCLGEHWLSAVPVVEILAVGGTTAIFTQSCANLLNAIGRPEVTFYVATGSMLVKLIGFGLLLPTFGLPGAAVAVVISSIVDLAVLLWVALPRIGISWLQVAASVVRPGIASIVMVFVLWRLAMAWTPSQGHTVLEYGQDAGLRSAIGAACYAIALIGLWIIAGRPAGPEHVVLKTCTTVQRRIRRSMSYAYR